MDYQNCCSDALLAKALASQPVQDTDTYKNNPSTFTQQ